MRKSLVPWEAPAYQADGLTGATAASRYVGATATGAPTTGTFAIGDFVIARDGHMWICTAAGSPGTWTNVGAVTSVAGRTGAITLTAADIGLGSFPAGAYYTFQPPGGAEPYGNTDTFTPGIILTPQGTVTAGVPVYETGIELDYSYWDGAGANAGSVLLKGTALDATGNAAFVVGGEVYEYSHRVYSAANPPPPSVGAVTSGLLGRTAYNPGTAAAYSAPNTNTMQLVDATNLTVSFIAPASGAVIVTLSAWADMGATTNQYAWTLFEGGAEISSAYRNVVVRDIDQSRSTVKILVTGLAPGSSHTYQWAHGISTAVTGTPNARTLMGGNNWGEGVMLVHDATVGVPNTSYPQNGITQPFIAIALCTGGGTWQTTTSTAPSDVNAAIDVVTFTAPASGTVIVTVDGAGFSAGSSTTASNLFWCLRDAGGTFAPGTGLVSANSQFGGTTASWARCVVRFKITGLTPGQSYTYRLGQATGTAAVSAGTYDGTPTHPVFITVQDAVLSPNMTQQSANPFLLGKTVVNGARTATTTSSTTPVVVDSTNLKVSFIAPASGQVIVRLSATAYVFSNTANVGGRGHWCLCSDAAGTLVAGTVQLVANSPSTAVADQQQSFRLSPEMSVTGLVPGQQYTFYWGHFVDAATTQSYVIYGDNGTTLREGAAVMEVWDGTAGQGTVQTPPGLTTLGRLQAALTANQTIAATSWTKITGWTVTDDPLGKWDATNSQWIAPARGTYVVTGTLNWSSLAAVTGFMYAAVAVNGVRAPGRSAFAITSTSGDEVPFAHIVRCNSGDAITLMGFQSSGGNGTVAGSGVTEGSTALSIVQIPDTSHAPSAASASQAIGARLYLPAATGTQTTNTWIALTGMSVDWDNGGFFASGSPTRLTVPAGGGGDYRIRAVAVMPGISGSKNTVAAYVNGQQKFVGYFDHSSTGWGSPSVDTTIPLNAGDYVELWFNFATSSTDPSVKGSTAPYLTYLEVVRQNSIALTDPTVATGDMLVRGSGGALSRLPVGATGSIPISDPTQPLGIAWTARYHGAKAILTANQTGQAVNTWNSVQLDGEQWDTDSYHDNITNKSRLTVPTGLAGKVELKGQVYMSGTSVPLAIDTQVAARWWKNGTTEIARAEIQAPHNTSIGPNTMFQVFAEDLAAVGDFYELQVFIATGTETYRVNGSATGTFVWATIKLLG